MTFEVWIGLWQKYFSEDPKKAFASLVYIGYCSKMNEAIILYKFNPTDYLKTSKRKVFNAYILCHHSCERLLDAFIKSGVHNQRDEERSVVNYITEGGGAGNNNNSNGKYLIVSVKS